MNKKLTSVVNENAKKEALVFDTLFDSYLDNRGADNFQIEVAYKEFCHNLLDVDPFQIDEIMNSVAVLCMEHEKTGFVAGIKTHACLMREISK